MSNKQSKANSLAGLASLLKDSVANDPMVHSEKPSATAVIIIYQAIWKLMSDFRERTSEHIAQFLVRSDFHHREAVTAIEYLASLGWFTHVQRATGIHLKLHSGIPIPNSLLQLVHPSMRIPASSDTETTSVTAIAESAKKTTQPTTVFYERREFSGDDDVQTILNSGLYEYKKAMLLIWKVMKDGNTRTSVQIKEEIEAMGVYGFDRVIEVALSRLSTKLNWFDRKVTRNEENRPIYDNTLRSCIASPVVFTDIVSRQKSSGYTCDPIRRPRSDKGRKQFKGIEQIPKQPIEGTNMSKATQPTPLPNFLGSRIPHFDNTRLSNQTTTEPVNEQTPPLFEFAVKLKGVELNLSETRALLRELMAMGVDNPMGTVPYGYSAVYAFPSDASFIEKKVFIKGVYFCKAELTMIFEQLRSLVTF